MAKNILTGVLILLISLGASAQDADEKQQLYVTDKLRLSLYRDADGKGGTIELLASGDKLTIEEVKGAYSLVTTPTGKTGWVKRGFLVLEPTSNLMLEEEKKRTENLAQEIDKLKNSKVISEQYEKDQKSMNEKRQALMSDNEKAEITIESLEQTVGMKIKKIETLSDYRTIPPVELLSSLSAVYWKHTIAIAAFIILISFFTGKLMAEAKVKRKFHGIKVW